MCSKAQTSNQLTSKTFSWFKVLHIECTFKSVQLIKLFKVSSNVLILIQPELFFVVYKWRWLNSLLCSQMFESVSILFSDVVTFTEICSRITPMEVVSMLNGMYSIFDTLTERNRVYKVSIFVTCCMIPDYVTKYKYMLDSNSAVLQLFSVRSPTCRVTSTRLQTEQMYLWLCILCIRIKIIQIYIGIN